MDRLRQMKADTFLDLGAFVGELTVEDDAASDDVSLEGLEQELQDYKTDDVVAIILSKVSYGLVNPVWTDYIKESDNLVSLHDQIHDCDTILAQMEKLLSGFQAEIGSISSDIKVLQEKSMDMGLKLKNRKQTTGTTQKRLFVVGWRRFVGCVVCHGRGGVVVRVVKAKEGVGPDVVCGYYSEIIARQEKLRLRGSYYEAYLKDNIGVQHIVKTESIAPADICNLLEIYW
ncbi:UNVERIFIED_CONTAM: Vacuolar protein sorting-associated protein 52 A [Sesamum calycinum]|uniref:Vacuolar protein sorting-associated protein 52 A n=1 Tax=Sesamum calycinum TaxID=2727403 RepID=A0AAW2ITB3_9LAMI